MRVIFLLLFFCSACSNAPLSVQTEYFSRNDLASVIVDTPDPGKQQHIFGQRLYISWSVTEEQFEQPLELDCHIKLKNGQVLEQKIRLKLPVGTYIFPIIGENYTTNGGLLSYQIKLKANGKVLATTQHKFWVKKIDIEE